MAPTAADGDFNLLEGLPPARVLLRPGDDKARIFGALRTWLKGVAAHGDLDQAGRVLGEKNRCAVLCFVVRESAGGVRRNQARDMLSMLKKVDEWVPQVALSLEELEAMAAEAAEQPPPSLGGERSDCVLQGLPSRSTLEDPMSNAQKVFRELHAWVKERKSNTSLAGAGILLDLEHRRSVFVFLCDFAARKTVLRSWCREVLLLLASFDEWCSGDAANHEAIAEALADFKDLRPRGRLWGGDRTGGCGDRVAVVEQKADEALPGASDCTHQRKYVRSESSEAPGRVATSASILVTRPPRPQGRREVVDVGGPDMQKSLEGLPSMKDLDSQEADPREVFCSLRDWVRDTKKAREFEEVVQMIGLEKRQSIFAFLCNFTAKKTVFREQARSLLQQLSTSEAWRQGGAVDQVALEKALVVGKDGRRSIEEASEAFADLPPLTKEPSMQTFSRRSGTIGSFLEVTLPTKAELAEWGADPQEILRKITTWAFLHDEPGCLAEEARQLSAEHREAIFIFLCGMSATSKSVFGGLVRKVLHVLDSCEEWRAGRTLHLSAEVSAAMQP